MDNDFVTTTQIGKQTVECKIHLQSKICYIRVTIPKTQLTFLPIFGFYVIPWIYTHKYVVYYDGWADNWYWSDHFDKSKSTVREKLDFDESAHDIKLLYDIWMMHSEQIITRTIRMLGQKMFDILEELSEPDKEDE